MQKKFTTVIVYPDGKKFTMRGNASITRCLWAAGWCISFETPTPRTQPKTWRRCWMKSDSIRTVLNAHPDLFILLLKRRNVNGYA